MLTLTKAGRSPNCCMSRNTKSVIGILGTETSGMELRIATSTQQNTFMNQPSDFIIGCHNVIIWPQYMYVVLYKNIGGWYSHLHKCVYHFMIFALTLWFYVIIFCPVHMHCKIQVTSRSFPTLRYRAGVVFPGGNWRRDGMDAHCGQQTKHSSSCDTARQRAWRIGLPHTDEQTADDVAILRRALTAYIHVTGETNSSIAFPGASIQCICWGCYREANLHCRLTHIGHYVPMGRGRRRGGTLAQGARCQLSPPVRG